MLRPSIKIMPGKWNYLVSKPEVMFIISLNDTIELGQLKTQFDRINFFKGWRLNEMLLRVSGEITKEDIDNYDLPIDLSKIKHFPFQNSLLTSGDRIIGLNCEDIITVYEIV